MAFEGYLLKSGDDIFPHQYINYESWDSTPNSREEIKAYRDDNTRNLTRVTAEGHKSSIEFKTRSGLHLSEKQEIQSWFTSHYTNETERKLPITYWNDESNSYQTNYFYLADIKFTIRRITDSDIIYKEATIDLVEY